MFDKKREEFIYVDLMSSIKKGFDDLNDKIESHPGTGSGDMSKDVYDKDNNQIVDIAQTLVGLNASIEELNSLIGVHTNIQKQIDELKNRTPKMIKTVKTIIAQKNQSEFIFDKNVEECGVVELRSNSVWIHDEEYTISENRITLKKPFPIEKEIDFIFYEIGF